MEKGGLRILEFRRVEIFQILFWPEERFASYFQASDGIRQKRDKCNGEIASSLPEELLSKETNGSVGRFTSSYIRNIWVRFKTTFVRHDHRLLID
jgi:hypothetical protein